MGTLGLSPLQVPDAEERLWVFGGAALRDGPVAYAEEVNELWLYNPKNLVVKWSRVQTLGEPPIPRRDHSMSFVTGTFGPSIILFGGRTNACILGDTWHLSDRAWVKISSESMPSPRYAHTMQPHPDGVFWVYGGAGQGIFGDLWLGNLTGLGRASWQNLSVGDGPMPEPRSWHVLVSMASYNSDTIWLHGGLSRDGRILADTWSYSVRDGWQELPAGPACHSHVAFFENGFLWMHGDTQGVPHRSDLFQFDVRKETWQFVKVAGQKPGPLMHHAGALVEGRIWLHGGNRDGDTFSDLWFFSATENAWHLEETYDSPDMVNGRHFVAGLVLSLVNFFAVLVLVIIRFELSCFRLRELGFRALTQPLWSQTYTAFVARVASGMLACSFPIIGSMILARWLSRSDTSENLDLYAFLGPAAYSMMSICLLSIFVCAVGCRARRHPMESLEDPMLLATFLLDSDTRISGLLGRHPEKIVMSDIVGLVF